MYSRPTGCACPRPIPADKGLGSRCLYCGTVAGEKWLAKGPCPCDWAEVERDQEGMSRDRRQGKLQAGNLGSPCWLAGCPQSASLPERVCGRSVAVSPSLGAARCQAGGDESGQLQLQGTLRSRPHVCERLQ